MTAAVLTMQSWRCTTLSPPPHKQAHTGKGRLAALVPRYDASAHNTSDGAKKSTRRVINVPKTRIPPRSRFGCWTCRTRKVKCDEVRPECTPCARLGHTCDYDPRLSFKDDTPRVLEKMSGSASASGPAWNPRPAKRQRLSPPQDDFLPAFATLTSDEDRERKAKFRKPGTYHVVVNPASFEECGEYRGKGDNDSHLSTPVSRYSNRAMTPSDQFSGDPFQFAHAFTSNAHTTVDDPDVVVLKVFEDDSRKVNHSPGGLSALRSLASVASTSCALPSLPMPYSISPVLHQRSPNMAAICSYENSPLMRMAHSDGRDHQLIYHYKDFVYGHLLQVHRDSLGNPMETGYGASADMFESEAANFLPLYYALMAFSALSMSQKYGHHSFSATALQHYQQALPSLQASLRTESDLASDGVFLTHFILLLYEIAAGELYGMSLWQQHISQLLRIVLIRREMYGHEPYSFIIWWVANIDTHVVLSGMGNGIFIETMFRHNLLPSGLEADDYHLPTSIAAATRTGLRVHDAPPLILPSALAFHRRICTLAAQLGLLARDLREEERRDPSDRSAATIASRQQRVGSFQGLLRRTWDDQLPSSITGGYSNLILPVGARGLYEHSFALHRALLLYTHTSLPRTATPQPSTHTYPPHRSALVDNISDELRSAALDILHLAREIITSSHVERTFIVFPLFMAGVAARNLREKAEVLAMIKQLESGGVGRDVIAAGELLEAVYRRQDQLRSERHGPRLELLEDGGWRDELADGVGQRVDWIELMRELGLQAVNCRL